MKIAFLNIYQGLVERGAERVVVELSERLVSNHSVKVYGGSRLPPQRWPLLWRFFIDPQGISIFLWTLKLLPELFKERFDIIIPTNGGWQPAIVRLVTWLYGGKMVIVGHSGAGWDERNNIWCFPDAFVAPSSFSKSWARKVNPFIKVEYIHNGVDISKFTPNGRKKSGLNLEKPIFLCVGALAPEKRQSLAITAVSKLEKGSLLIVGRGQLEDGIRKQGEKMLGNRFKLKRGGFDEMPDYYRAADVFTTPTAPWQSFELVVIEALATNLPVVANKDQIRQEIIGDAGILVDVTDTDAYSKALEEALKRRWGNMPRKQAEEFSWDTVVAKYEKLFEEVADK